MLAYVTNRLQKVTYGRGFTAEIEWFVCQNIFFDYSFNYKRIVQDEKIYLYHFVLIYVCT